MKILHLTPNSEEWLEARKGKITGSKLGDIVVKRGSGKKIGFYELIADRLAVDHDGENMMDRGHRLELEGIEKFESVTGKSMVKDVGICVSDFNENIAVSPDGLSEDHTEAVEVKCLSSPRHLQAVIENKVPAEYEMQILQYFIVIEALQSLYMVFYDPRIVSLPYHAIHVTRDALEVDIEKYKAYQIETLREVDEIVERLAF